MSNGVGQRPPPSAKTIEMLRRDANRRGEATPELMDALEAENTIGRPTVVIISIAFLLFAGVLAYIIWQQALFEGSGTMTLRSGVPLLVPVSIAVAALIALYLTATKKKKTAAASAPPVETPHQYFQETSALDPRPKEFEAPAGRGATAIIHLLGTLLLAGFTWVLYRIFLAPRLSGPVRGYPWLLLGESDVFVLIQNLAVLFVIGVTAWQIVRSLVSTSRYFAEIGTPVPRVTLTPGVARPGGDLRIDWRLTGNVKKLKRLRISIVGVERAEVQQVRADSRGDVYWQSNEFADVEIAGGLAPIDDRGTVQITFPASTMHSFTGQGSSVTWLVRVRGERELVPTTIDDFSFVLAVPPVATSAT